MPTLGELQHFLRVISEEIAVYQVWPVRPISLVRLDSMGLTQYRLQANCWFFCSLLQEHLEGENQGRFIDGSLQHANLARRIRDRVKERLRLFYHIPIRLTVRICGHLCVVKALFILCRYS